MDYKIDDKNLDVSMFISFVNQVWQLYPAGRFLWGVPRLSLLPDREPGGDQHAIKGAAFE